MPVLLTCDPLRGAPCVAGLCAVGVCGDVAHRLEGVSAVAEVLCSIDQQLKLVRLHLRAVLCGLELLHLGHDAVDGAVEAGDLAVQHVD